MKGVCRLALPRLLPDAYDANGLFKDRDFEAQSAVEPRQRLAITATASIAAAAHDGMSHPLRARVKGVTQRVSDLNAPSILTSVFLDRACLSWQTLGAKRVAGGAAEKRPKLEAVSFHAKRNPLPIKGRHTPTTSRTNATRNDAGSSRARRLTPALWQVGTQEGRRRARVPQRRSDDNRAARQDFHLVPCSLPRGHPCATAD